MVMLMAVVGGRLIPTFTGNWLAKRNIDLPAQYAWLMPASIAALSVGLLGWAGIPNSRVFGAILMLGGVLNLSKLAAWRGLATRSEPLLFILHVAYLWMVAGVFLLGLAAFDVVPQSAAIHALTAGAMGTMILAVMTRVARGHSGQSLTADAVTQWIYGLVTFAAVFSGWSRLLPHRDRACCSIRPPFYGLPPMRSSSLPTAPRFSGREAWADQPLM